MNKPYLTTTLVAGALMLAVAALASGTPAAAPKPEKIRSVRVIVNGHEVSPIAPGAEEFFADDEDGAMAFDDETPGGGERKVIVRCFGHGPGGMEGRGFNGPGGMGPRGFGARGPMGGRMAMMHARMAEQLHLTDEQRTKMRDIHERQMRRGIQGWADLQLARMDMHKLMRADQPQTAAINAQIDKMARMRADQAKARVASRLEARAVLTPEQQKQMREMRMHPGMPGMMHGMGGPGDHGPMGGDTPDSH